ncbi:MAG: hypothetical protein WCY77_10505 [Weeksellaceae bacterium]
MKKSILFLLLTLFSSRGFSCAWYEPDSDYYNLFVQETINSPMYEPFLLAYDQAYYSSDAYYNQPNENIEDWQAYFNISYDNAYYLVFSSRRDDVQALAKGNSSADKKLDFIDEAFKTKYKQALLYLAYAKYLEPYMAVKPSGEESYYWGEMPEHTVAEIDYSKVITVLTKSWHAETDKDLKLRYGYQLVRFAHYNRKNKEAINFFNQYVESLNHKSIMYYYALDQKGGAERALGNFMQANHDFFQFFIHTKNRKESAYTSMKVTQDLNFQKMLGQAKSDEERIDLYMLLGYQAFNNPISQLNKIIALSPDAIQAKVLMARAVNELERNYLPTDYYCGYDNDGCMNNLKDNRLPLAINLEIKPFFNSTLDISIRQSKQAQDKDFWNLTTAYLYFLSKEYAKSKEYLAKVNTSDSTVKGQKQKIEMLLEIVSQKTIDAEFEKQLMTKHKSIFGGKSNEDDNYYSVNNSTSDFILDILANRYFIQKEYGKSFLLLNKVTALESNPDLEILNQIESLYRKKDKNSFETYLMSKINASFYVSDELRNEVVFDFENWLANMKGTLALSKGDLKTAKSEFSKVNPKFSLRGGNVYGEDYEYKYKKGVFNGFSNISENIFGYTQKVCYNCAENWVMKNEYLNEFPFIKSKMNKLEVTHALIQLNEIGNKSDERASKANYLLSNFYYNTTILGYFREFLRFDVDNSYGGKFHDDYLDSKSYDGFYFKGYEWGYKFDSNFERPMNYAVKALEQAKDDELKARILWAASNIEQAIFYNSESTDKDILNLGDSWDENYSDKLLEIKVRKYRKHFKELKKYSNTNFYKEVKSNCKYFNYYSTHY